MKIAIIGAAGVRTPLIVEAMIRRQSRLGLEELALMDIDAQRLAVTGALTGSLEAQSSLRLIRTTDPRAALAEADFVITTFRVGGIESRIIDERVPLEHGALGQETTGPGGFAMGLRTVPVLLEYIKLMSEMCPEAWLINFANPAGMLTEAAIQGAGWSKTVGICDAPSGMQQAAAALLHASPQEVTLDYFGLNHLGWVRRVFYQGHDHLPGFIKMIREIGRLPELPFEIDLIESLGIIPNEYNYYYYYKISAVQNILNAGQSRGEEIARLNLALFETLQKLQRSDKSDEMMAHYQAYLNRRGSTYMSSETGDWRNESDLGLAGFQESDGYASVALDLIEALSRSDTADIVLNIPNKGAVHGMDQEDVVEIPAKVSQAGIQGVQVGEIPAHALGLMKQVKAFERLTIQAALENSYQKALLALTLHPLVMDRNLAKAILDDYISKHSRYFPVLK
jgi:6-phospho-beta-glucosidase